jgi:hypothetical protein
MINGLVALFGRSQIPYFLVGVTVLFAFVALASVPDKEITRRRGFEGLFLFVAGLTLLVWRWPTFLWQNPMSPDEGQWVAAAMKTTVDWVPWRGFDLGTSGPLSAYVLALPALLGRRIDFFSTRLLGVCLLTVTVAGLYCAVKWLSDPRVARLAVIPSVLLLALTNDWNFLHFSSEIVPIFLTTIALAAGAYLVGEGRPQSHRYTAIGIAGLCLGSTGLAKIQSMPIAVSLLILLFAAIVWTHRRARTRAKLETLFLVLSLLTVPAMIVTVVWVTGGWDYAVQSFLKHAIAYVQRGQQLSLAFLFEMSPSYAAFLVPSLLLVLVGAGALFHRRTGTSSRSLWLGAVSLLLLLGASVAIYTPKRAFPHYLLFSVVPLSCCVASVLALTRKNNLWRGRETYLASAYAGIFLIPALAVLMSSPSSPFLKEMVFNSTWIGSEQAVAIARNTRPGDYVAIWGSHPEYFVQTGTIMATRYPQLVPMPGPSQDFYEQSMLKDLQDHVPRLFVDAFAPDPLQSNGYQYSGYETFPILATFVTERFVLEEEVGGVRIFVLKSEWESKHVIGYVR